MIIKQESLTAKMTLNNLPAASPLPTANLVLAFGAIKWFEDAKFQSTLQARYPTAQIVGCTTSGEITSSGAIDDSLQITAILWEKTIQRVAHARVSAAQNSFETGSSLAKQIKANHLKTVIVFADGLTVNGEELVQGFKNELGDAIPIFGGMAGDGATFTKTLQLSHNAISNNMVVAVGLYGTNLVTSTGALGGWKPYGPPRMVTRSEKNVVYELDGKPALPLYRMYIGDHYSKGLPATGLKFPFAVMEADSRDVSKIRTLSAFDSSQNSVSFFGNVSQGSTIRMCQTSHERLLEGAGGAAQLVMSGLENIPANQPALALCISCIGRKLVMGDLISDEVNTVKQLFGPATALTGFYSYGEIAPRPNTADSVLHNQTMTIGYITEV